MKRTNKLMQAVLVAATMMLAACAADDRNRGEEAAEGQARVTLNVATRAAADVPENEKAEYQISSLRVYAFDAAGSQVGYAEYPATGETVDGTEIRLRMEKMPLGRITFYAVANAEQAGGLKQENGDDYTLGTTATPADLEKITFSTLPEPIQTEGDGNSKDETGKKYTAPLLPMAVRQEADIRQDASVALELKRSVAKLKLYFAKAGFEGDKLYMGRGLYLYNQPEYGYLFPGKTYTATGFNHMESPEGDKSDSHLNQKGGRVVLSAGWAEEPEGAEENKDYDDEFRAKTHINEIKENFNDYLTRYQQTPDRPVYLFANPNAIPGSYVQETPGESAQKGYYLKILTHDHLEDDRHDFAEEDYLHVGEMFYVSLPAVAANDVIEVRAVVNIDWRTITTRWMIIPWQEAGGDITFD